MKWIVPVLLLCCFFIVPVSAVGSDNLYNGVWFADNKTYAEKVEWFKELISFSDYGEITTYESRLITNPNNYDNLITKWKNGEVDWDSLTTECKLAIHNYILNGDYALTDEQIEYRDTISKLYSTYIESEENVQHDIDNGCIPTLNDIPPPYHVEITEPTLPTPQER